MAVTLLSDPPSRINHELQILEIDYFDLLPDDIFLIVLNKIGDVKTLGQCCVVSRRFHSLVPQVENVVVHVDCVLSDVEFSSLPAICHLLVGRIDLSRQKMGRNIAYAEKMSRFPKSFWYSQPFTRDEDGNIVQGGMKRHSVTQLLNKFEKIRYLHIKLPRGEYGVLTKWRAEFGSTLDNIVVFSASSIFCKDRGMLLAYSWAINILRASSERLNLVLPIISKHKTLESLILTDADGQGVICMDKDQLEELRIMKELSPSKSTIEHLDLKIRRWFAPTLELPDGTVYEGAVLTVIRLNVSKKEFSDISWIASAFEEPYQTAAKMLVKLKAYSPEP